jgi:hypothetical protein
LPGKNVQAYLPFSSMTKKIGFIITLTSFVNVIKTCYSLSLRGTKLACLLMKIFCEGTFGLNSFEMQQV